MPERAVAAALNAVDRLAKISAKQAERMDHVVAAVGKVADDAERIALENRRTTAIIRFMAGLVIVQLVGLVFGVIALLSVSHTAHAIDAATNPASARNVQAAKDAAATSAKNRHDLTCNQEAHLNALFLAQYGPGAAQVDCNTGAAVGGQTTTPVTAAPSVASPAAAVQRPAMVNNITVAAPPAAAQPAPASPTPTTAAPATPTTVAPCTVGLNGKGCVLPGTLLGVDVPLHVELGLLSLVAGGFGMLLLSLVRWREVRSIPSALSAALNPFDTD